MRLNRRRIIQSVAAAGGVTALLLGGVAVQAQDNPPAQQVDITNKVMAGFGMPGEDSYAMGTLKSGVSVYLKTNERMACLALSTGGAHCENREQILAGVGPAIEPCPGDLPGKIRVYGFAPPDVTSVVVRYTDGQGTTAIPVGSGIFAAEPPSRSTTGAPVRGVEWRGDEVREVATSLPPQLDCY